MNTAIEDSVFKRVNLDFEKISAYGFTQTESGWIYKTNFMNGDFKAIITVDTAGHFSGTVYEIVTEDEYLPLRVEGMDGFAAEVRDAYTEILKDIKEKCCHENVFIYPQTNRLADEIYKKYGDKPVFPWDDFSGGVFKNPTNGKWYAIVMALNVQRVDKKLAGEVEVVNIKLDPEKIKELHKEKGFYPAYHMNKKNWISILLNDTVPDKVLLALLDESHHFTINKRN